MHKTNTNGVVILDQGETMGGAEHYLLDMLQSLTPLEAEQLQVTLLGGSNKDYRARIPEYIHHESFPFTSFKGGIIRKLFAGIRLLNSAKKLARKLAAMSPRIVLTNTSRTHFCMFLAKKLWGNKDRWVVVVHDFHTQKKLWKGLHLKLRRNIYRMADDIIVVSMVTRAEVKKYLTTEAEQRKIKIIENGIHLEKIPEPKLPTRIEKLLILGRIDPRKGQLYGIEALRILRNEGYENLQLFFVGSSFAKDPETVAYEKKLKKYTIQQNLSDSVHFLGQVDDPYEAIIGCDALLMLPTEAETFGRIAIEGLSMNKIVLSFDQTGPKEILEQYGRFAHKNPERLLSPVLDATSMAENIAYFIENPAEIQGYGENGRAFVEKYYALGQSKKAFFRLLLGQL